MDDVEDKRPSPAKVPSPALDPSPRPTGGPIVGDQVRVLGRERTALGVRRSVARGLEVWDGSEWAAPDQEE